VAFTGLHSEMLDFAYSVTTTKAVSEKSMRRANPQAALLRMINQFDFTVEYQNTHIAAFINDPNGLFLVRPNHLPRSLGLRLTPDRQIREIERSS
jgi:hypothetical protein